MTTLTAKQEWSTMWPLPLVAMLGISGVAMFAYSSGVFMVEMTRAFGWSRAAFSAVFILQTIIGLFVMPVIGRVIDRVGPRRMALWGIPPYVVSFGLLGFANGSIWQWVALCSISAIGTFCVAPVVWITAIVGRFHASRGAALAVALTGLGVATAFYPPLAAFFIEHIGWRLAFPAMSLTWGAVMLPLVYFCFHGPRDRPTPAPPEAEAIAKGRPLMNWTLFCLVTAGALFVIVSLGFTVHLVAILHDRGMSLTAAAGLAGMSGIFSIIGRLGTGALLDRLPTRPLAIAIFLLPIVVSAMLFFGGTSTPVVIVAIAIFGLAAGAETDVVTFIAARRFPRATFASSYAVISAIFSVTSSLGPVLAGALFDATRSYDAFLIAIVPIILIATTFIWLVPRATRADERRTLRQAGLAEAAPLPVL